MMGIGDDIQSEKHQTQKPMVYIVGFTCALAGLLFGLDVGVISGALDFIAKDFGIGIGKQQLVVSAILWGAMCGAVTAGFVSRLLGRKLTLLIAAAVFAIGSLGCAIAPTADFLIALRFVLGIAVGMASFTAPLYLSEISPQSVRGAMISLYQLMITIGILSAFLSDTYLSTYADIGHAVGGHWRLMLGVIALPAMMMFIGFIFLPESPRWLLLKNRVTSARKVLSRIRSSKSEVAREMAEIEKDISLKQKGFHLLFHNSHFRRAVFLGISLQVIQQLTGINVIMYYAPKIFKIAGFATTAEQMWGTVVVGLINVLATFIAISLVDRIGRKPIMYIGFTVMGISMTMVGVVFKLGIEGHQVMSYLAIVFILLFIIGFAMSAGPIVWVICTEIYPIDGRDLGITISTATNWIVNGLVAATFLTMLKYLGSGNTFIIYGALEVFFIIFFLIFVPETKGVTLEKIASNLMNGKRLRDIGR
jgi:MFS transporter, SP family, galactose:H+ symporter